MHNLIVVCADVVSVAKDNFGWCSSLGEEGSRLSVLAEYVAVKLNQAIPLALGFECPLFVPLRGDEERRTKGREGDGRRPWIAGAGCSARTTGLVQVAWVLEEVRRQLARPAPAFLNWSQKAEKCVRVLKATR